MRGQAGGVASGLLVLGSFGPTLAAVVLVGRAGGRAGLRAWLARGLGGRVGWGWAALAVGLPLGVVALAAAGHRALGGALPPSPVWGHGLMAAATFGWILVAGGPLGEEFGWRGYALPALQARYGWRVGSLVLGGVWGGWHLPLFFLADTSQRHIPIALFLVSTVALSVLFAWLARRTAGSLVLALLLHTAVNYWTWVVPVVPTGGSVRPYALTVGLLVALAFGLWRLPDAPRHRPLAPPPKPPPATATTASLPAARNLLLALLGFLGLGAVGGGGALALAPSGRLLGLPLALLAHSPFRSFLVPGLILFFVLGVVPCLLVVALVKKPVSPWAERLNLFADMHWAWTGSVYVAFALIIWLQVEMMMLNAVSWLHTFYMGLAVVILCVALLPGVRALYKK